MHVFGKKLNYKHTVFACYMGYLAQAIVINYVPLLYVTFQTEFGFSSLSKITLLTTICFSAQLLTDLVSGKFVDKIGYRASGIAANLLCAAGLFSLAVLPKNSSPRPRTDYFRLSVRRRIGTSGSYRFPVGGSVPYSEKGIGHGISPFRILLGKRSRRSRFHSPVFGVRYFPLADYCLRVGNIPRN